MNEKMMKHRKIIAAALIILPYFFSTGNLALAVIGDIVDTKKIVISTISVLTWATAFALATATAHSPKETAKLITIILLIFGGSTLVFGSMFTVLWYPFAAFINALSGLVILLGVFIAVPWLMVFTNQKGEGK